MNYIINVTEFWFYIIISIVVGCLAVNLYYKNKLADLLKEQEIKAKQIFEQRVDDLLSEISEKKQQVVNIQNKVDQLHIKLSKFNDEKKVILDEKQVLLDENNLLTQTCEKLVRENEMYQIKHKQVEFEVATVQKYYKDARIDTTMTF
ncbi:hypothetical protein [Aliivibrio fischeri]|uniref:hypothetical protein n=1 Tax=Aliivibrio fischeri TaxID=668 RepID=UPI0007C58A29|nr:hypothetical protein [Aliivibrio fischeri]